MPAKSQRTSNNTSNKTTSDEQSLRSAIMKAYRAFEMDVHGHYGKATDEYVPRSCGHMAHHSNHNNVKIEDCFESVKELVTSIMRSAGTDSSIVLGTNLHLLEEAFEKYNTVFEEDYIHYFLLEKAASMGISGVSDELVVTGEERRIADRSSYALYNFTLLIRMFIRSIRMSIEKIAECEKNVSLQKTSSTATSKSIKAQRSALLASASKKKISC